MKKLKTILFFSVLLFTFLHTSTCCYSESTSSLSISEVMPANTAFRAGIDGKFRDWIEIANDSDNVIDLSGYGLSDRNTEIKWLFPEIHIPAHGFLLVDASSDWQEEALNTGFAISAKGESIFLFDRDGNIISEFCCPEAEKDTSYEKSCETVIACTFATPGFPNTMEGYLDYCHSLKAAGPLIINEAVTSSNVPKKENDREGSDWIELKNISDHPVLLSDYFITDQMSDEGISHHLFQLPQIELQSGELYCLSCADNAEDEDTTGFGLDCEYDKLYLFHNEVLEDYVSLRNIPIGGSIGRMEDHSGYYYFSHPSRSQENTNGFRFYSSQPTASIEQGIYPSGKLSVQLTGEGDVYYTTDGSVPTTDSEKYTTPISVDKTTIIRAISKSKDSVQSDVATFSYIIDNSTLPVVSLVFDDYNSFLRIYNNISNQNLALKSVESTAVISFFDGNSSFSMPCGVHMRGYTSLNDPKKSMGVYFRDRYGKDKLIYDIFQNGITEYSSLLLRAGQDYNFTIIRNELFQQLCLDMTDKVPTQEGRFCTLFINGNYWGLYSLKEDFSSQYYASHYGISKESVERQNAPIPSSHDFYKEVFAYALNHKLSTDEAYKHICSVLDIDNFIDWVILEGVSANSDTVHNLSIFRSRELDNKWRIAYYDLDWALWYPEINFTNILEGFGNGSFEMTNLIKSLFMNQEFKERFLTRFIEVNSGALSNEHILEKIDELAAIIEPEVLRDLARWTEHSPSHWPTLLQRLKDLITDTDWAAQNREVLKNNISGAREYLQ